MAVLDQVVRIQTNRTGAVADVETQLESSSSGDQININVQHLPTGTTGTGLLQASTLTANTSGFTIDNGNLSSTVAIDNATVTDNDHIIRRGDFGTGINVASNGTISAEVSVGSVHIYASTTARNAATDVTWHVGDVAVINDSTNPITSYIYDGDTSGDARRGTTVNDDWSLIANAAVGTQVAANPSSATETLNRITIAGTNYNLATGGITSVSVAHHSWTRDIEITVGSGDQTFALPSNSGWTARTTGAPARDGTYEVAAIAVYVDGIKATLGVDLQFTQTNSVLGLSIAEADRPTGSTVTATVEIVETFISTS